MSLWEELGSGDCVQGVWADLLDFLAHKHTVRQKEDGMLMSVCEIVFWNWKEIYEVIENSSEKVMLNKFMRLCECSLVFNPGDWKPVASLHTGTTETTYPSFMTSLVSESSDATLTFGLFD